MNIMKILSLLILFTTIPLLRAGEKKGTGINKNLIGNWVSKSINGDALFFVVSQIGGKLEKSGKFTCSISYTDFQTGSQTGTYKTDDNYVYLYAKGGKKPYKVRYHFKNKEKTIVIVTDEAFGVSLTLKKSTGKGKKQKSTGGGLMEDL